MQQDEPNQSPHQTPSGSVTPTVAPQPTTTPTNSSKTKAVWALVLAIAGMVLGILWFISIPLAIAGLILGIIVLVKRRSGKRLAVAAVVIAGLALLVAPIWIGLSLAIYNGVAQVAINSAADSSNTNTAESDCFSFKVPVGYEVDSDSNHKRCDVSVNIPGGDSLTQITVKGETGEVPSRDEMIATLVAIVEDADGEVEDSGKLVVNGAEAIYVKFKDETSLSQTHYYVIDPNPGHRYLEQLQTVYIISGGSYNMALEQKLQTVVDSFTIK